MDKVEVYKSNIPIVDEQKFKEQQGERFVKGVEDIGNYFNSTLKQQKINNWISIGIFGIFFLAIVSSYFVMATKGSGSITDRFFDDTQVVQRYNCSFEGQYAIFRDVSKAKDFLEIYPNSTCFYVNSQQKAKETNQEP